MHSPFQQSILILLAQQTTAPTTTPATTTSTTKSGPTSVAGSPTNFDPYQFFPTIITGYGSNNITPIRHLSYILNWAIYILSSGHLDINKLRTSNFIIDPSQYSDPVLRGLVKYVQQIHRLVYTNYLAPFKSPIDNKLQRLQALKNFLPTFQIPDGGINALLTTKIGGNLKSVLLDTLSLIK